VRITSTLGNLFSEAIQNVTLAIWAAAVVAAPLTGGASLSLLVPVGIVGAVPSAYRLVERARTATFELDLESATDILNIAASAVSVGRLGAMARISVGANPSLRAVWVAKGLMIFGLGLHGLNAVVLGATVIEQLAQVANQKNLSDSERRAQMMLILGNVMIQVGMAVGEKLSSRGRNLRGTRPGAESSEGGVAKQREEKVPRPTGGEMIDPRTAGKTMSDLVPGGGKPLPAVEREAVVRDVRSQESLFARLAEEGMRREAPAELPQPTVSVTSSKPRMGVTDVHEAYRIYDEALRAHGSKKEVAIYRDVKTGDYAVVVGSETAVNAPVAGDWEGVLHYHPNPYNAKQFRLPAPADFLGMMRKFVVGGRAVREFLEYDMPGVGRGRTEFGISADNEKPFYVRVFLPDGSSSTLRFAHDGTYAGFWSGEKTYVDPESPLYRQMLHDIPEYLKQMREARQSAVAAEPSAGRKTAAGVTPPPQAPAALTTARGDLTEEGVQFLRKRFPKRFANKTADKIRHEFAGQDSGDLLEAVGKEEAQQTRRGLGSRAQSILLDAKRQNLASIAKVLGKKLQLDTGVLRQPVLEFVRTEMPEAFEFMNNHPDMAVREAWVEFAWGPKAGARKGPSAGFLLGTVGNKKPDIVEVFPGQKRIIVTDITHRAGDPIHNFKTLFYATVMERMTGFESGALDYRSVFRQTVVELPAPRGAANP
jgi:hypothetical protein